MGAHYPIRSERTTSSIRAAATWLSATPMLRFTSVCLSQREHRDDPRGRQPAAGGHRPLEAPRVGRAGDLDVAGDDALGAGQADRDLALGELTALSRPDL